MASARKILNDRTILMLMGAVLTLGLGTALYALLRIDSTRLSVPLRVFPTLGVSHIMRTNVSNYYGFVAFALLMVAVGVVGAVRYYRINRSYATTLLGLLVIVLTFHAFVVVAVLRQR